MDFSFIMKSAEEVLKIFNEKDLKNRKWLKFINDLFWPISHWPKHIIKNLFNCEYGDRLSLTSFLYKNGFPPDYFLDFVEFYARPSKRGTSWQIRKRELMSLWKLCEDITKSGSSEQRKKYFYYSMNDKLVYNYANEVKYFGATISVQPNKFIAEKVQEVQQMNRAKEENSDSMEREHLTMSYFEQMTENIFKKMQEADSNTILQANTQEKIEEDSDSDIDMLSCAQETSDTRKALDYLGLKCVDDLFDNEEESSDHQKKSEHDDVSDDEYAIFSKKIDEEINAERERKN